MTENTAPETGDAERGLRSERRRFLQATGGVLATALAGCSGGGGPLGGGSGGVGEKPDYAKWIAPSDLPDSPTSGESYGFLRVDFAALQRFSSTEGTGTPTSTATETEQVADSVPDPADDMVLAPLSGSVGFVFLMSFGLLGYGDAASGVVAAATEGESADSGAESTATETPHTTNVGMMSGDSLVFEGSFDTEAITSGLESFEQAGETGEFTIYEGVESESSFFDTSNLAFALRSDAAVFALPDTDSGSAGGFAETETPTPTPEPETATESRTGRDIVDDRLAVVAGETEDAVAATDDFGWVIRAGGTKEFVTAGYGRDAVTPTTETATGGGSGDDETGTASTETGLGGEIDAIEEQAAGATMFANSSTLDRESEQVSAEFGFVYGSEADAPSRETLESFVESADESNVTLDGTRAAVEGTWNVSND